MRKSLIQGLNEKDMQAVVNTYNLNAFYFPSIFPLKFNPTLTWKTLQADLGIPVAADVVAFNSSAPKKTRQILSRLQGDIPKIEIARIKEETDLNEYNQLLPFAKTTDGAQALLDFIYDDVSFCFTGVNARLEWLALRALSTGKIVLDSSNNAGVVTETAVDFLVPSANKGGVATVWSTAASATPLANIKAKVKTAKGKGYKLGYAWMDQDTFDNLAATAEVQKAAATWVIQATDLQTTPSLDSVNKYMASNGLPQIIIVESYVTIELADGTRTSVNPWEAGVVVLTTDKVLGNTYYAPLADELVTDSVATKVKRGAVLIKKFSTEDPVTETTKGMANAFPAFAGATRSFMIDTTHTSWSH